MQRLVNETILNDDALVITAPGLDIFNVIMHWIVSIIKTEDDEGNTPLVFLINATDNECQLIESSLLTFNSQPVTKKQTERFKIIGSQHSVQDRQRLYNTGGVVAVSSRALVVDWLNQRVPEQLVSGILLLHADRVAKSVEGSYESFVLRVFRECNQKGFIKAFSDNPNAFSGGFNKLEKCLKYMQLKKVFLFPRFHVKINEMLNEQDIDFVELHQPMTKRMILIQRAIVDIIDGLLQEIRRSNPQIDADILTVENALTKNFDAQIHFLLDPTWHRVSPRVKRTIQDLNEMRKLLKYLVQYDCVSFWQYLEINLLADSTWSDGFASPWRTIDSSDSLIKYAKERVYKVERTEAQSIIPKIIPILEENPKWELLLDLLEKQRSHKPSSRVLIMVNEIRSIHQLNFYIEKKQNLKDGDFFLNEKWKSYLYLSGKLKKFTQVMTSTAEGAETQPGSQSINGPEQPVKKRSRRARGGKATTLQRDPQQSIDVLQYQEISQLEPDNDNFQDLDDFCENYEPTKPIGELQLLDNNFFLKIKNYETEDYGQELNYLQDFNPDCVILLDPNPHYIRTLEGFKLTAAKKLKVFFTIYEDSAEEQLYLTVIKNEKLSFERLIREKSFISIGELSDVRQVEPLNLRASTRIAGGSTLLELPQLHSSTPLSERPLIVVDMREFRSQLPVILHASGFHVRPIQIEVGDYILTPKVCVERKTLSDLVGSLQSGRLYSQVESMVLHYENPILLIEFDQSKQFSLQDIKVNSSDRNTPPTSVTSKLVQFTILFPKLRIIWSTSPHATAEIFKDLKHNQDDPDVSKVMQTGDDVFFDFDQDPSNDNSNNDITVNRKQLDYNVITCDVLQQFPGLEGLQWKYVANRVKDFTDLCNMDLDGLKLLLNNDEGARQLYKSLHDKQ